MKDTSYVYCICRIDRKNWKYINQDLLSRGYNDIKAYIPTVKILKKVKGNTNVFEEIPLLFNYGFIKMRTDKAFDRQFLLKLKKEIPGIMNWLKSLETIFPKKKKARIDNYEDFDDFSIVATVSKKEYLYYKKLSKRNTIYSSNDIVNLTVGSYVILRGYPFEGIPAKVLEVNLLSKKVNVALYPDRGSLEIQISLDNILYSIYNDYDEDNLLCSDTEVDFSKISDNT